MNIYKISFPGKIYIASMNMRGKWAEKIDSNSIILNVTSMQSKTIKNRRDFSPMTEIKNGYNEFWNFESFWQSGKVFDDVDIKTSKEWWKKQNTPKRRYPNLKNKKVLFVLG